MCVVHTAAYHFKDIYIPCKNVSIACFLLDGFFWLQYHVPLRRVNCTRSKYNFHCTTYIVHYTVHSMPPPPILSVSMPPQFCLSRCPPILSVSMPPQFCLSRCPPQFCLSRWRRFTKSEQDFRI